MKTVFLKAYFKNNLGDDLFLQVLSKRYENTKFYAFCSPKYRYNGRYENIIFVKSFFKYYFYRLLEKISKKSFLLENERFSKSDILLTLGGSIFIENKNNSVDKMHNAFCIYKKNKPYYILGANFGPYYNEFYKNYINDEIFKDAEDVCFRDSYSYELFENMPNVRKASDVVFSLDTSDVKIIENNRVIFSIIDCKNRFTKEISDKYEEKIIELINYFASLNYDITLMSFCKSEGDEDVINRILKQIGENASKLKIDKYFYRGNITEALNILGNSKIIVGSRFHSMILGMLLGKTIIPIVYSDKTLNLLDDIGYKSVVFDIRKASDIDTEKLDTEALEYKVDVTIQKTDAVNQFKKLDEVLK